MIRPELLVRDAAGIPMPPAELLDRLHQRIGPEWGLKYLSASWAVTREWPPNDPRREWIKTGETDPAFAWDIIGYLPITCSVDEAPPYLERMLRTDSRDEVQKKAGKVAEWNTVDVPKQIVEQVLSDVHDEMGKNDEVTTAVFATTPAKKATKRRPKFKTVVGGNP